jgi:WD40 repeat protein
MSALPLGTDANARPSTPLEAELQSTVIGAPRTSPPTANTNPSDEQTDPKLPYTAPPKVPLKPTAEHLAKWNISEAEPLQLLACYDGFSDNVLQALTATPDGKQFVVGGARLSLWKVGDAEPLKDLLADKTNDQVARPILAAAISPDGTLLAAGDHDGRLFAWKLSDHSKCSPSRRMKHG